MDNAQTKRAYDVTYRTDFVEVTEQILRFDKHQMTFHLHLFQRLHETLQMQYSNKHTTRCYAKKPTQYHTAQALQVNASNFNAIQYNAT